MLSIAFSLPVSAEDTAIKNVDVNAYIGDGTTSKLFTAVTVIPQNGVKEFSSSDIIPSVRDNFTMISTTYNIHNANSSPLFYSGRKTTVKLSNVYYSFLFFDYMGTNQMQYLTKPDSITAQITYTDNTRVDINTGVSFTHNGQYYINCEITFTPEKDVKSVTFVTVLDILAANPFTKVTGHLGEVDGDGKYTYKIEQSSEEAGLLSGIIGKLQSLWDTVVNGFNNVATGIGNIVSKIGDIAESIVGKIGDLADTLVSKLDDLWGSLKSIVTSLLQLPSRIWSSFKTGLQELFVPSTDALQMYFDAFDDLLVDKFGLLYEVFHILFEKFTELYSIETVNEITLPEVSVNLAGTDFVFGGWTVTILPNDFVFLAEILKTVTGMVCTLFFVNGLRKRFEEVLK